MKSRRPLSTFTAPEILLVCFKPQFLATTSNASPKRNVFAESGEVERKSGIGDKELVVGLVSTGEAAERAERSRKPARAAAPDRSVRIVADHFGCQPSPLCPGGAAGSRDVDCPSSQARARRDLYRSSGQVGGCELTATRCAPRRHRCESNSPSPDEWPANPPGRSVRGARARTTLDFPAPLSPRITCQPAAGSRISDLQSSD